MTIRKAHIKNFTVFEEVQMAFSKGINILIGTSGTGKTHLLKSLYMVCERQDGFDMARSYFSVSSGELVRSQENKRTEVKIYFSENSYDAYMITGDASENQTVKEMHLHSKHSNVKSIFISAKEMLAHSKGFLALNNKYDIPFDKTYVDILTNAELPEAREISELNGEMLRTSSKVIDGKVIHENGMFYVVKTTGNKIGFPIEAEGLRKFGLLWKLIRNGLLEKGTILYWDEPEANINPELMPILVELLLELQRKGVQIFIATHSYNLAKYFEVKRGDNDDVLYHHLFKTECGVKVDSNSYFGELTNNPIINADAKLLDEVIEGDFDD